MTKPLFLIVTPSYNQSQFIQQTIDSVLSQTKVSVEYVVMDGGSTDDTVSILKKYGKQLRWISEKDKGQTDAINKGMGVVKRFQIPDSSVIRSKDLHKSQNTIRSTSSGEHHQPQIFFAYINSDDYYLHPEVFSTVAQEFANHPDKQWVVGDAVIVDEKGKRIQSLIQFYKKLIRSIFPSWILFVLNPYPQPATFVRWSAVQDIGTFNEDLRYTMDYEYWLRLRKAFGEPIILHRELSAFRIHGLSKGGSQFDSQFAEELTVAKQFTRNPVALLLHRMHNWLILTVYSGIK